LELIGARASFSSGRKGKTEKAPNNLAPLGQLGRRQKKEKKTKKKKKTLNREILAELTRNFVFPPLLISPLSARKVQRLATICSTGVRRLLSLKSPKPEGGPFLDFKLSRN
jgi:hypothetical protein